MKLKRIDAIIKGKASFLSGILNRKAARIMRNVESAIAYAEDKIDEITAKGDDILNSLAEVAECDMTQSCSNVINKYVDTVKYQEEWKRTLDILNNLKEKLNETVEVQEEEEKK